jgi:hypothetical protein
MNKPKVGESESNSNLNSTVVEIGHNESVVMFVINCYATGMLEFSTT